MGLASLFGFRSVTSATQAELPDIFSLAMKSDYFVDTDVMNVYSKILTDCIDRTQGIPEKVQPLLWDNFLQNEATDGLISLISKAMAHKDDLFLVYDEAILLLRQANPEESKQIEEDYQNKGESDVGIYVSFECYHRTDMVRIYSSMEYCTVASLNKMMNLSKALQLKMNDLRGTVSLSDSAIAIEQAQAIAIALARGKDVLIDKNDEIFTGTPDISSIKESIQFLDAKKSFYYGMPLSYINGEQTPGIGSTGEADAKAVERGLRQYFTSVLKPILDALFDIKTSFKSNDFRQIASALEAIKTFELVGDDLITLESKRLIISKLFDIDLSDQPKGDAKPIQITVQPPFGGVNNDQSSTQPGD
jgi:hypothetical protein